MLTLTLKKPICSVQVVDASTAGEIPGQEGSRQEGTSAQLESVLEHRLAEVQAQQGQLAATVQLLDDMVSKCRQFYEQVLVTHRKEIARLALEIARKVVVQKVKDSDYDMENIIEEALKHAPVQQGITVHLHPDDLNRCQAMQREQPDGPLGQLTLVADVGVGQAECWLETPKGIIQSFINEHIHKIAEALEKAS